eukprot:TRINITY_DN2123_c0_g2_i1.p1 TRINITY_DN2123_c0_g2~~TRINITY_DN2123_c0_g2_i1.p1  ORF type:complete len:353 (-),score=64.82 TRINITY_DN2123_c0_g2_i1:52-1077(-)
MALLVTGGLGFIGSITCVELLKKNYDVVILDNLANSKPQVLPRIKEVAEVSSAEKIKFYKGDICKEEDLEKVFVENKISGVIHFAGYKAVGESVEKPLEYYENNIFGTVLLLKMMRKHNVFSIVFSSSSTVYGAFDNPPFKESSEVSITKCPYGNTKLFIEQILKDLGASDPRWRICMLRYFNPVGAHPSGKLGEDPLGIPTNLMPYIAQVAVGKLPKLNIFGKDYPTTDGTAIRDYIHVVDVAIGHVAAVEKINKDPGVFVYNLATGQGTSVLEVVQTFQKATGVKIEYEFKDRRAGDVVSTYADCSLAEKELKWKAVKTLEDMCRDMWNFQSKNPNGYA